MKKFGIMNVSNQEAQKIVNSFLCAIDDMEQESNDPFYTQSYEDLETLKWELISNDSEQIRNEIRMTIKHYHKIHSINILNN